MINISRSQAMIDPNETIEPIHIIGAGMTGSKVARQLVKLGYDDITVYDFDVVESHNIANQEYCPKHIGINKVYALKEWIHEQFDVDIKVKAERVGKDTQLKGIVFLLTDTFDSRREIMESLKMQPHIKFIIETRVDTSMGYVNTIDPMNLDHIEWYLDSLFEDDDTDEEQTSACGGKTVINHTGDLFASMATWEMVKALEDPTEIGKNIMFSVKPYVFIENVLD